MRREDKALVLSQEGNVDAGKKYGGVPWLYGEPSETYGHKHGLSPVFWSLKLEILETGREHGPINVCLKNWALLLP